MTNDQTQLPPSEPQHSSGPPPSLVERLGVHPMLYGFGVLAAIFVLYQIGGGLAAFVVAGSAGVTGETVGTHRLMTMVGQLAFVFLPTLVFARLFSKDLRYMFPMRLPSFWEMTSALVAMFALQRLLELYLVLQDMVPIPEYLQQILDPLRSMLESMLRIFVDSDSIPELIFVSVVVALVPGVVEELLFRGLVQRVFERVLSPVVTAILSGIIFGLYHLNPFQAVPLIVLGVFFGGLRLRSRTLVLPMAAHFLNNMIAVLAVHLGLEPETAVALPPPLHIGILNFLLYGVIFVTAGVAYLRTTENWRAEYWRENA